MMVVDVPARRRPLPVALVAALRPKQWTKNGLLFAALIFSGHYTDPKGWLACGLAFVTFCLLSSTGYVYNDLRDAEADRNHPKKRFRPIAAGELSPRGAWMLMVGCFVGGLAIAALLGWAFVLTALLYFVTTLSYSLVFKHMVIL